AIGGGFFRSDQLAWRTMASGRIEAELLPCLARARRIAREDTADDAPVPVELSGGLMHAADPRGRPATDQRQPQRPAETFTQSLHAPSPSWCGLLPRSGARYPACPAQGTDARKRSPCCLRRR